MDVPCHELFARSRRTGDQNPAAGRSDPPHGFAQLCHRPGLADEFIEDMGDPPQLLVLAAQSRVIDRPSHGKKNFVGLQWLFDEIVGADLGALHGGFDRAVTADHENWHEGIVHDVLLQEIDTIASVPAKPYIENQQGRNLLGDGGISGCRIGSRAHRVALVLENAGKGFADIALVVPRSGCRASWMWLSRIPGLA